jgi:hypothetical protein
VRYQELIYLLRAFDLLSQNPFFLIENFTNSHFLKNSSQKELVAKLLGVRHQREIFKILILPPSWFGNGKQKT